MRSSSTGSAIRSARSSLRNVNRHAVLLEDTALSAVSTDASFQFACRWFVERRFVQAVIFACLLIVLLIPDLWVLADQGDNLDVYIDILLMTVFAVFMVDFIAESIAFPHIYRGSFFFWMDLLGSLAVLLDLSFATLNSVMEDKSNFSLLRAARLAKLGSRAGRFSKLLRLLRFLPGMPTKFDGSSPARRISRRLFSAVSKRTSCLIILMTLGLPLFSLWTFPEEDFSMDSWVRILETIGLADSTQLDEQLVELERFYADLSYFPFEVVNAFNASTFAIWRPEGTAWNTPTRSANIMRYESEHVRCAFNFTAPNRLKAALNLATNLVVVFMLIFFSCLLSNSVSGTVLLPLERLLDRIKATTERISKSVEQVRENMGGDSMTSDYAIADAPQFYHFQTDTQEGLEMSETELLHVVLEKLVAVGELVLKNEEFAENVGPDGLSQEQMSIMTSWQGGTSRPQLPSEAAGEMRTSMDATSIQASQEDGYEFQMAMLLAVGLSLDLLDSMSFNSLELDKARCHTACMFFLGTQNHGVECDHSILQDFLTAMEGTYKALPYHSWFHGVDVTHSVYRMLRLFGTKAYMSGLERFALLVSATGHDCGHVGLNNQFLVETAHELALLYNDRSPMENMHCATLFGVLNTPGRNIFKIFTREDAKEARRVCIESILNTDNAMHFKMTKDLQLFFEMHSDTFREARLVSDPSEFPTKPTLELLTLKESRQLFGRLLVHLADISNPMRPFRVCCIWARRVLEEFFTQGDLERAAGIPVQSLNDRERVNTAYSQIGFIDFLVAPLACVTVKVFPPFEPWVDHLVENARRWQAVWAKETKPEPSPEERTAVEDRLCKLELSFLDTT